MKNAFDIDYQNWVDGVLAQSNPIIEVNASTLVELLGAADAV